MEGRGQAGHRPGLDSVEGVERVSPTGRAGRQLLPQYGRPGGGGAGQGTLGRVLGRKGGKIVFHIRNKYLVYCILLTILKNFRNFKHFRCFVSKF